MKKTSILSPSRAQRRRRRQLTAGMLGCAWLIGASSAFADDGSGPAAESRQSAQEPAQTLPAVKVQASGHTDTPDLSTPIRTGSRLGLSSLDTPASVETLTGEQIQVRGDTTVNEAITRAAGFATDARHPAMAALRCRCAASAGRSRSRRSMTARACILAQAR
ncbi:outer membrane receptor for ferric coprogen and ferric-rhodotorulic acid [Paraburkholderia sp. MM5477-R1]